MLLGILAHAVGWPFARGGAQAITDAMGEYLRALGGDIVAGWQVQTLDELPPSRAILLDVTPRQVLRLAGARLPAAYRRRLERFRYGPSVFKVDYALSDPVPWRAQVCRRAGAIHLGGTLAEIAAAEEATSGGRTPRRPYVLVAQHSLFDRTRAPAGKDTLWAYCHTPHASTTDMTAAIEAQIERFAPDFRDTVLAAGGDEQRRLRTLQPQLCGRRHKQRRAGPAPTVDAACVAVSPIQHAGSRALSVFLIDAARGRCPWHVRLQRGSRRAKRL